MRWKSINYWGAIRTRRRFLWLPEKSAENNEVRWFEFVNVEEKWIGFWSLWRFLD